MSRLRWKPVVGVLALVAVSVIGWLAWQQPFAAAQQPSQGLPNYEALFKAELQKVGQISPEEFALLYPAPGNYLAKISWDPTTAKFWDEFNQDPGKLPQKPPARKMAVPFDFRLNEGELAKFKENGFVVSERLGASNFAEVFYRVYYRDLPVYVSSDAILHAWHRSYDAMLAELEETYLANSLAGILTGMLANIPAAQKEYGDGPLVESLKDADYFLATAYSLLTGSVVDSKLDQRVRVETTLMAIANLQMQEFELFGRQRDVDFSQFKVRGHYEKTDQLKRYFKAMMWCGRTDMRIAGGKDESGELSSPRELGSAIVLHDLLRRANKMEQWQQFDRMLQTFVGRTDSATFAHLDQMLAKTGIRAPGAVNSIEKLEKLQADILKGDVGKQAIAGDLFTSPRHPYEQVELPRSFTFLGQKFVVDSWVTSKVVFDQVLWNGAKVARRVPSCLDVAFAALGNSQVAPLLTQRITEGSHPRRDKSNYQHHLAAARNVIDGHPTAAWNDNLYMGWLGTLRELSKPTTDAKYPEAMRTQAWAMKSLNTQMASWTQLRHDTILYAKQSYSIKALCYYPAGFVEPVPHFWQRLEQMVKAAALHIEQTPYPDTPALKEQQKRQASFLRNFATKVQMLKGIAEKQLAQMEMVVEEINFLKDIVEIQSIGCVGERMYKGWYPGLFYTDREDSGKADLIVADVHTNPPSPAHGDPGCILHQGIGNVDLMLIGVDSGKDRMVFAGPVMSHYEFEMPGAARKSDSEWSQDLMAGRVPPRPEWTRGYLMPRK